MTDKSMPGVSTAYEVARRSHFAELTIMPVTQSSVTSTVITAFL